jgi:fibronectin-binding autotransporter adhesin
MNRKTERRRRFNLAAGVILGAALASLLAFATPGSASTQAGPPAIVAAPAISGSAAEGSTLTVSSGSWSGDAPITFGFQWLLCDSSGTNCANIAGATGQTYTVVSSEVGSTLRAAVTATNAAGASTALTGPTSVVVAATAPVNTAIPVISGSAQTGQILTTSDGTWSGSPPPTFTYEWQRCNSAGSGCAVLSGQHSSTYAVVDADIGSTIRSLVTATNSTGTATAQSSQTAAVAASGSAPRANGQGNISGTLQVGSTLSVSTGWSGASPIAYSFQWERCDKNGHCVAIPGATGQTYVTTVSDIGFRLRALVAGRNAYGSSSLYSNLTSAAIAAVGAKPALIAAPAVTGSAQVGGTLTTTTGTWSSSTTLHYAYAWLRCDAQGNACSPISGATGQSWKLTAASAGHTVRSQVTATNLAGSSAAQSIPHAVASAPTGAVPPSGLISVGGGMYSVSASAVSLPARLIVSGVSFTPSRLTSRAAFTARFRVTDTRGYAVRGALVYLVALPYGSISPAPEVSTDEAGYATIVVRPTSALPLRKGALVMFVRARKQGDSLLAGVSTRRLVQVLIGR